MNKKTINQQIIFGRNALAKEKARIDKNGNGYEVTYISLFPFIFLIKEICCGAT